MHAKAHCARSVTYLPLIVSLYSFIFSLFLISFFSGLGRVSLLFQPSLFWYLLIFFSGLSRVSFLCYLLWIITLMFRQFLYSVE